MSSEARSVILMKILKKRTFNDQNDLGFAKEQINYLSLEISMCFNNIFYLFVIPIPLYNFLCTNPI